MFRYIMACLCLLVSGTSIAQISSFRLQASGLTCALCARSIHKNLETVAWISRIETDLERSEFIISIKPDMTIDADLITKKVKDAGFGVAGLTANARLPHGNLSPDRHLILNGMSIHIVSAKQAEGDGEIPMRLVDKSFLGSKDQKKYSKLSKHDCFITGKASGDCCRSAGIIEGSRIFHVII
jgi:copper chaperone CopZ